MGKSILFCGTERVLFSLVSLGKTKSKYLSLEMKGGNFLKCLGWLSFLILFLIITGSCRKEDSPIPSFCAAESDWGPNNLIVFANEPWVIMPPETLFPPSDYPRGLWTVKPDGSELKFLVGKTPDGMDFGLSPDWFPCGEWIVANDDIGRIWMVTPEGDSFIMITQQGRKFAPSISPDGRKIAFFTPDSDAVGTRGIRILDLDSGSEKLVFPYGGHPSWSPCGSRLVFFGWLWETNRWIGGIIVVDTSGANARMVLKVDDAPTNKAPSFSPDGKRITFHIEDNNHQAQIWLVNADGSKPRKLTSEGGGWASWSPDGKEIVYTRVPKIISIGLRKFALAPNQEGVGDLYIINADGSGEKRITFFYPR